MKKQLKSVIALTAICAVISILLALTNYITAPIIEQQQNAATNEALAVVLPSGEGFEAIDLSKFELPDTIVEGYSEKNGGCVFKMETSGYGSGLVLMCGIDKDGNVTGATYISSNETLGYEKTYGEKMKGATLESIDTVDTVGGATMTTLAYRNAVKDALGAFIIVNGGSADLRDEAEILNDTLSELLPDADGKFTAFFKTEQLQSAAVYKADNDAGYVFLYGEQYVAVDAAGSVLGEVDEAVKAAVSADAKALLESTLTEIDISKLELPSQIEKAYKTASGNFVFDLKAAGYGINGDKWTASGEYIKIKISVTNDGKVIDCLTVSQKESEKIGDACGKPEFYNQFVGKDETNYKDIDAISGATITTNGYTTAVSKAFEAVKILKGVA